MTARPYQLARRPEIVATYAHLEPGDTGQPIEPAKVAGTPGARPDSFADLTVAFHGVNPEHGHLVGSNDGKNWFAVHSTAGVLVSGGKRNARHVKADQFQFYAPAVFESAPAGTRVTAEIHLTNR